MDIDPTSWPSLSRLIDRMLDLPPQVREDWVHSLSGEDAGLAPRLLELLHPAAVPTLSWLETLPKFSEAPEPGEPGQDAHAVEQPGDRIGPYRLVRMLGSGGMGSVWYALRVDQMVRRPVALKLPLAVPSRVLAARFERERDILASLVHPNIARLYDAGISEQGRAFLALEYVEGRDLDRYSDERRLDLGGRIDLFLQVLAAVQHAHGSLVIHRDIKPQNILVTAQGSVRLLDFGVAKLLGEEQAERTELTRLAPVALTPAYAAPEQICGEAVSTATDIYALGVVLFELLTGVRPYRLQRESRGALEEAILRGDIPRPSSLAIDAPAAQRRATTPARLRRALRGDLDAILLKALQRDPRRRYLTAQAFADDLAHYRTGRVVEARTPSRWYELGRFVLRNRVAVASAAAVSLALLIGAAVALWQAREAKLQASIAAAERDRALAAAGHREAVEEFLFDLMLEAGRAGAPISIPALVQRAKELSEREFADNPEVRAAVLKTVAGLELNLQGIAQASAEFGRARELLAQSQDSDLRAGVVCAGAMVEAELGREREASQAFDSVIGDPASSADALRECYAYKAQLAAYRNDGPAALIAVRQALEQWQRGTRRSPVIRLELQTFEARALSLVGLSAQADAESAQVLEALKALGRDRGTWANKLRRERSYAAMESGDLLAALAQIEDLAARQREDFPGDAPVLSLYARGRALLELGRYREALAQFEGVSRLAVDRDPLIKSLSMIEESVAQSALGHRERAEDRFKSAVESGRAMAVSGTTWEVTKVLARARLDLDQKQLLRARKGLSRILELDGVPVTSKCTAHRLRARALLGLSESGEALREARQALEMDERQRGDHPYSAWVGVSDLLLGKASLAMGERAQGLAQIRSAIDQMEKTAGPDFPDLVAARRLLSGERPTDR
jgi:serine/threonine-protein kinase